MNNKDEIIDTTSFLLTPINDISNNGFISRVSYEITVTQPPNNWLLIHGTAMGAGIVAASMVYSTVKATGTVAASTAELGINIGGTMLSESTRMLFGDIPAAVVAAAVKTTATVVNSGLSAASSTTAVLAGAVAGAAASATTLLTGIAVEGIHSSVNTVLQYFTGVQQPSLEEYHDMSFIIYDISSSNVLCYDTVTLKSDEQNNNYGFGDSKDSLLERGGDNGDAFASLDTSLETVQMDTKSQATATTANISEGGYFDTVQTVGTGTGKQKARNRNS